jgi:hypothetical protein
MTGSDVNTPIAADTAAGSEGESPYRMERSETGRKGGEASALDRTTGESCGSEGQRVKARPRWAESVHQRAMTFTETEETR